MNSGQRQEEGLAIGGTEVNGLFFYAYNGAGECLFHSDSPSLLRTDYLFHGMDFQPAMTHTDGEPKRQNTLMKTGFGAL